MEKVIKTLAELDAEAARFIKELAPKENGATFIALSGELGAGKTAFTKAVAKVLGVEETVNSPTFVLEKIYLIPERGHRVSLGHSVSTLFTRLIHIDAYRLESGSELAPLGFDEILKDAQNLILLEWPEKVADTLPTPDVKISFVVQADNSRTISYA